VFILCLLAFREVSLSRLSICQEFMRTSKSLIKDYEKTKKT